MKWRNHRLVSGTAVFVMTGHLLPALCAACGSIFPDAIEGRNYSSLLEEASSEGVPLSSGVCHPLFLPLVDGS